MCAFRWLGAGDCADEAPLFEIARFAAVFRVQPQDRQNAKVDVIASQDHFLTRGILAADMDGRNRVHHGAAHPVCSTWNSPRLVNAETFGNPAIG